MERNLSSIHSVCKDGVGQMRKLTTSTTSNHDELIYSRRPMPMAMKTAACWDSLGHWGNKISHFKITLLYDFPSSSLSPSPWVSLFLSVSRVEFFISDGTVTTSQPSAAMFVTSVFKNPGAAPNYALLTFTRGHMFDNTRLWVCHLPYSLSFRTQDGTTCEGRSWQWKSFHGLKKVGWVL